MKTNIINNFLIIHCIGKNDKLGLRINKDFFVHNLANKKNNETLVSEIYPKPSQCRIGQNFSVIVNQGQVAFQALEYL